MIDIVIIDNENEIARHIDMEMNRLSVYDDGIRAYNAVESSAPPIVFVNYKVQKRATAEYISLLFNASATSKIVLIAEKLTDDEVLDCIAAGANGYMQTNEMERFINKLIAALQAGEAWITRRMVSKLLARLHNQKSIIPEKAG